MEYLGWGLVNLFLRAAAKKHQMIDRLTDEIRLLLAEQDGSEVATADLEDKIDLARKIEQSAEAYETMRDTAARHYLHETGRSEEHTSELQSLMRISYAVFCLKKKTKKKKNQIEHS